MSLLRVAGSLMGLFFLVFLTGCDTSDPTSAPSSPDRGGLEITASTETTFLMVYKSPTCGCCKEWISHIERAGFTTETRHPANLERFKDQHGIATNLRSCHTAVSPGGYVFEGHIPARYIQQFLDNPPADAIGLSVPGMPVGSPGMEVGDKFIPYQVLLLKHDGSTEVFARVEQPTQQYQDGTL